MMIARWQIDARFVYKQEALNCLQRWNDEIATQIGIDQSKVRLQTGCIGAKESTIEMEMQIENLAQLEDTWKEMSKIEGHNAWSKEMEKFVVSATPVWTIFRVL
ncbi:MAG: hypothetical protein HRU38_12255 [Saccharospirillaceae bacterium]|nr:hypothetical protein [Pseudomonadales bacterium]NRB79420.1 hypothetical protein [Saccharospirillaceae bacterium]